MLSHHAVGMAETYCEQDGPNVVLSYKVEEFSTDSGDVQRLSPTGGWNSVRTGGLWDEYMLYLGVWDPFEVSHVRICVVQAADESSSVGCDSELNGAGDHRKVEYGLEHVDVVASY